MRSHARIVGLALAISGAGWLGVRSPACAREPAKGAGGPAASTEPGMLAYSKRTYVYKTVGDCKIQADVYRLPGEQVRPGILWIHGGALISGSRGNLRSAQMEKYLAAGYAVVSIDYRLAPETKLAQILEDLRDAYAWMRAKGPTEFHLDPDHVAVIGHSAGGYLTLMAGFVLSPRPKALVSFYGYGDIVGPWYSRPDPFYSQQPAVPREEACQAVGQTPIAEGAGRARGRFYLYCRQQGLWPKEIAGHDPNTEPRAFDPFCPVRNVTREYPPTMLLHGDKDTDVPFELSVAMRDELARQGIEHEFIPMTNRGHGFDGGREAQRDPEVAAAFVRVFAFLKKHLQ